MRIRPFYPRTRSDLFIYYNEPFMLFTCTSRFLYGRASCTKTRWKGDRSVLCLIVCMRSMVCWILTNLFTNMVMVFSLEF